LIDAALELFATKVGETTSTDCRITVNEVTLFQHFGGIALSGDFQNPQYFKDLGESLESKQINLVVYQALRDYKRSPTGSEQVPEVGTLSVVGEARRYQ